MLSEERRRAIEAEEAERIAEEAYRREVRSRMAQPEPTYPTPAISTFDQDEESKGGVRFWQVLALVAVAVAITYAYTSYSSTSSTSQSTARASSVTAFPTPRPVYVPRKHDIATGQIVVLPGRYVYYRIRIRPEMRNPVLTGSFNASGGSGNDVMAVVTTETEFQNWINDHESRVLYSTRGRKTTDSFRIALPEGDLIFAISNKFSVLSQKTVFLNAELKYETLTETANGL